MNERPVMVLAETGFIIRNLLLGHFAIEVGRTRKIIAAVPDPESPTLLEATAGLNISFIRFNSLDEQAFTELSPLGKLFHPPHWIYRIKQGAMNSTSIEIQTRVWESTVSVQFRAIVSCMKFIGKCLKGFGLLPFAEDLYFRYLQRQPLTVEWEEILNRYKPSVLLSTMLTHNQIYRYCADLPPLLAARKLGIPAGMLVQSWDNLASKASVIPPWLDRYWTWSDPMSLELKTFHPRLPMDRINPVGSPQFDFHTATDILLPRADYLAGFGLDPERPYIVIATATRRLLRHEHLKVFHLAEVLRKKRPDIQCIVRLHPKDMGVRWEQELDRIKSLGLIIQKTSQGGHMDRGGFALPRDFYREQVNIIHHSAMVVNTASTIAVDAAIIGRPIIAMDWDEKAEPELGSSAYIYSSHYLPLIKSGGIAVTTSPEACAEQIMIYLDRPEEHREGRESMIAMITGRTDGKAGERLAQKLLALSG